MTTSNNTLKQIEQWHKDARKEANFRIALAVHIEEFVEMMEEIDMVWGNEHSSNRWRDAIVTLDGLSHWMKADRMAPLPRSRKAILDALGDQIVTAVGVGAALGMDVPEAVNRVAISNDTKRLADGSFMFNEQGKIAKPPGYVPPDLEGLY
jgi:hypothetical protein